MNRRTVFTGKLRLVNILFWVASFEIEGKYYFNMESNCTRPVLPGVNIIEREVCLSSKSDFSSTIKCD
jgi:hypothetical protein